MELPNVKNFYYDKTRNFKLIIYAYRKLSKAEILLSVEMYKRRNKLKYLPNNKTAKWITTFGNDSELYL